MFYRIVAPLVISVAISWLLHSRYKKEKLRKAFNSAVESGNEKQVSYLLAQGANVNDLAIGNWNSLHIAIWKGHYKLIRLLIQAGVDTEQVGNICCYKPIHVIIISPKQWCCLKELIKCDVSLDSVDDMQNNLIHLFVRHAPQYPHIIMSLIAQGVDPNATDVIGYNPLHYLAATQKCGDQITRLLAGILLKNGANVNTQCLNRGLTPLHLAVISKNYTVADYFLRSGALLNLKDYDNKTAFDHLFENENEASFVVLFVKYIVLRNQCGERIDCTTLKKINSSPLLVKFKKSFEKSDIPQKFQGVLVL